MKTRFSIDLFLLGKFQNISDFFQDWFGWNNFDIAKIFRFFLITSFLFVTIFTFLELQGDYQSILNALLFISMYFLTKYILSTNRQECKKNPTFANPAVVELVLFRNVSLFLFIIFVPYLDHLFDLLHQVKSEQEEYGFLAKIFFCFGFLFLFFFIYFVSCTPKPQKPSKAKKFISKIVDSIRQVGSNLKKPVLKPTFAKN